MLDLDLIREHCRVDPEDVSDELLTSYHKAAISLFEHRTGRQLWFSEPPNEAPDNAVIVTEDIRAALLMLTDHFNTHKSVTTGANQKEVPLGVTYIMNLHRWFYESS